MCLYVCMCGCMYINLLKWVGMTSIVPLYCETSIDTGIGMPNSCIGMYVCVLAISDRIGVYWWYCSGHTSCYQWSFSCSFGVRHQYQYLTNTVLLYWRKDSGSTPLLKTWICTSVYIYRYPHTQMTYVGFSVFSKRSKRIEKASVSKIEERMWRPNGHSHLYKWSVFTTIENGG